MLPESLASLGLLVGKGLSPSKLLRYGRAYTGRMAGESKFHGEVRRAWAHMAMAAACRVYI